jgi:hypothetical protein
MRESCTSGSVRGARGNSRPYRNRFLRGAEFDVFRERRASSELRPIGLNQIEPVVRRAGCQFPANLHVANPSSEPRTTIPTSAFAGGAAPGPS